MPTVFSAFLRPLVRFLDYGAQPKYHGKTIIPGLKNKVEVTWSDYAIPHVVAADEFDLLLAQGYLHAQERLWQMEMSRRFLSGRMAEIFGNFALPWRDLSTQFRGRTAADFDYFVRLLGIRTAALASVGLLSEREVRQLNAYSTGVNRYIEQCGSRPPWEFRALRHQPEPWTLEDSLTINKGFAFLLSTALYSRLNFLVIAAHLKDQPAKLQSLMPHYPFEAPTITEATWNQARALWEFTRGASQAGGWHPAGHGSNSWVVAPDRSTTDGALLCNDPHLRMTLPSNWYVMHLQAEICSAEKTPYEVWGATIPGLPYAQLGRNRWIAWGVTAALCDDVEIYRERLHPVETNRYLHANRWHPMIHRTEHITVRGKGIVERSVRSTHHGPILSDFITGNTATEVLAVKWTAHEPSRELHALFGVNRARDWHEFLNALGKHTAPSLNFVYADVGGNIGYALAGKIPARRQGSLLPLEGWFESNEWQGFIPFDELPRLFNPPDGVIAAANNKIVGPSYPYHLSPFFEPPHRIQRIEELLAARERHSPVDLAAIQMDTVSRHAFELVEALRDDLNGAADGAGPVSNAVQRLLQWDGDCSESSVAATIFHVFHQRLLSNLLTDTLGEELIPAYTEILNQCLVPTDTILKNPSSVWFQSRSRAQLVAQSLAEACSFLEQTLGSQSRRWHWGRLHALLLNHPFSRTVWLQPLLAIGPMPAAGDGTTVNLGFYRHSNPYRQTVGASLRFIIDLKQPDNSGFVLASGQSGHPLSKHYADQNEPWRQGHLLPFSGERSPSDALRLVLEPK
ncbi:MAG TPA: penicillin acylase family protein [Terriglobales bacterium]|nr:penicillin acylase family protein [Terriglobales bacterium]